MVIDLYTAPDGDSGFQFEDHFIRLVRDFTTEAGTTEEIGFVATDLAKALEIGNSRMLTAKLDPDQKGVSQIDTLGGIQSLTVISESGFYDVVVRSDKPQGKALRAIVTREVLPQIRKTGTYAKQGALAPASSPMAEMGLFLNTVVPALTSLLPDINKQLLTNKAVEGCARQWPDYRPMLEPVKLALAVEIVEEDVNVTALAKAYAETEVGKVLPLTKVSEHHRFTLNRKSAAVMMNELLIKAGLQVRIEGDAHKTYAATEMGKPFSKCVETEKKEGVGSVLQLRWLQDKTLKFVCSWVETNCEFV